MSNQPASEGLKSPGTTIHLVSGASAGLVSAIILQPLDLLKTRLQQQQKNDSKFRTNITNEVKKLRHFKELWRGALPSTIRTSMGAGLYFTILSASRNYLSTFKKKTEISESSALPKLSHFENLATGFVVRAVVGMITMPITVIKTRFESNLYSYNSLYEGFDGIYRNDKANGKGSAKNFFKGSLATLARDCPYAGMYILFYEGLKNDILPKFIRSSDTNSHINSSLINSSSAFIASSLATTISAPFDAIKTRLQLSSSAQNMPSASIWETTKSLISEEGKYRNLFRGLSLRLARKGLSAGISWCIYEELIKSNRWESLFMSNSSDKLA